MLLNTGNLISVVMPVWRPRHDWLLASVKSVLGQKNCDLELIVVDDGNADPVAPLLSEIQDSRMRVLRIDHAGHAGARNAGVAAAQGQYVRHFDCDDIMPSGSTARLAALGQGDGVITYGATQFCDEALNPTKVMTSVIEGDALIDCLLGRFSVRCPAMLFPREVVELTGPWNSSYGLSEDWEYVLRALEHAPVRGTLEIALLYRKNLGSVSRTATIAAGEDAWRRIIKGYFDRHPEQRGSSLERRAVAAVNLNKAVTYAHVGSHRESILRLGRAALLDPRATFNTTLRLLVQGARHRARSSRA